ncbi:MULTISPECIES: hypothetical protein [Desulfococcus]|nr:hypothetical protein [Desulfococcus multivorans]
MMKAIAVYLDDTPVRFTDDGRVFVIDAIAVVAEGLIDNAEATAAGPLWDDLVRRNPELMTYCREIDDMGEGSIPVADSGGWDKIHEKLFELLLEQLE